MLVPVVPREMVLAKASKDQAAARLQGPKGQQNELQSALQKEQQQEKDKEKEKEKRKTRQFAANDESMTTPCQRKSQRLMVSAAEHACQEATKERINSKVNKEPTTREPKTTSEDKRNEHTEVSLSSKEHATDTIGPVRHSPAPHNALNWHSRRHARLH